jgi:hypothetical protein
METDRERGEIMRLLRTIFLVLACGLLIAGCTTFKASGLAVIPAGGNYTIVGDFHTEVWINEFLGASAGPKLFNITADATDSPIWAAIDEQVRQRGGIGAINIAIEHKASFANLLLNALTSGLYAPSIVRISGTVIK